MKCPKCQSENTDTARFCSNCAALLTASQEAQPSFTKTIEIPVDDLSRGTLFAGRYEIIEELGRGGNLVKVGWARSTVSKTPKLKKR
jgi:hypothetical protein